MHHHQAQALNPAFDPPASGGLASAATNALVSIRRRATPEHLALGLITAISLGLGLIRIGQEGYANAYYAAAVRSMLENWHAFFFASFDAKGFVTVDKPPMGLWIQTASAWLLGYHGWSILLPQILASTGSVLVLYAIVRKPFGAAAGLLAALALAVAPVNVAVARNNSSDDVLAFFMLLGAVCLLKAARQGSLRWLAAAMAMLGVGFNIKMLEAYLALPAFLAVYLLAAAAPFWRRIWQLALASVVLVVISFSWATAVALTPASARPYVGSTQDNNIFSLIFGYNGLNRLLPRGWSILGITSSTSSGFGGGIRGGGVGGASENGAQGVFRLLNTQLGGQIGWLIPLAVIGLVVAWGKPSLWRFTDQQRVLLLLGVWAAVEIVFFSVAGFYHRYYMATLSPAIAGLAGVGFIALWRNLARGGWRALLLPAAVAVTAASQYRLLNDYPVWQHRLGPVLIAGAALAIIVILVRALQHWRRTGALIRRGRVLPVLAAASALTLLAAPAVWSYTTTESPGNATMPSAGPSAANFRGPFNGRGFAGGANDAGAIDSSMVTYLEQHQGSAVYLLAVSSSQQADQIIISTGKAVMAMGGFSGSDPILTVDQLKQLVANGKVRFFMLGGRGGFGRRADFAPGDATFTGGAAERADGAGSRGDRPTDDNESRGAASFGGFAGAGGSSQSIDSWIQQNCQAVSSTSTANLTGLYDCQAAAS